MHAELRAMEHSERSDLLEELVVSRFRAALLMEEDEELELDVSYFDLGLTSLRLTEMRSELEALFGVDLDATVLFNRPTVEQLLDYLGSALSQPAEPVV